MHNTINPCRPGFGASCSFCCGSHNYTATPGEIEELFISRGKNPAPDLTAHPEAGCFDKLEKDGMQCPHAGISPSEPGLVCCLVYFDELTDKNAASFFSGTCKHFQCSAWKELTGRQILFAAELLKDWYYYSLLIQSPEHVMDLCACYERPHDVPQEILIELKNELLSQLSDGGLI